jgi:D-serine deaminase-like pyridoxal phosphate-dependent protein
MSGSFDKKDRPMQLDRTGFDDLTTPALLLDEARMTRNIERLAERARALGVTLRPHLKTAKSAEIARRLSGGLNGPITVSTLAEAEAFHAAGHTDILYAVGIAPQKLTRVQALRAQGCDLVVILDSPAQARAVAEAGVPALIEIDSDGHRGGLLPDDPALVEIGRILRAGDNLRGVMTHAGESYTVRGEAAHAEFAERERSAAVKAADALRDAGLSCPVVSVGSTPTAHAARDLSGVTELRAGVYMFFDLVMVGIEVCGLDDIALTVLTTVIGHQPAKDGPVTRPGHGGAGCGSGLRRCLRCRGARDARSDRQQRQSGTRDRLVVSRRRWSAAGPPRGNASTHPAQPCLRDRRAA